MNWLYLKERKTSYQKLYYPNEHSSIDHRSSPVIMVSNSFIIAVLFLSATLSSFDFDVAQSVLNRSYWHVVLLNPIVQSNRSRKTSQAAEKYISLGHKKSIVYCSRFCSFAPKYAPIFLLNLLFIPISVEICLLPRSLISTWVWARSDERVVQWFSRRIFHSGSSVSVRESPKITIEYFALVMATFNRLAFSKKPTLSSSLLLGMTSK